MYCANCGNENPDNAKFCKKCGAELKVAAMPQPMSPQVAVTPQSTSPYAGGTAAYPPQYSADSYAGAATMQYAQMPQAAQAPVKKRSKTAIIIAAAAILVLIIAVLAIFLLPRMFGCSGPLGGGGLFGGGDYMSAKFSIASTYSESRDHTIIAVDGKVLDDTVPGYIAIASYSLDSSKIALCSAKEGVYVLTSEGLTEITDEFATHVAISPDGNEGVYVCEDGIFLFNTSGQGEPEKISDDDYFLNAIFSPDGNTMVYTTTTGVSASSSGSGSSSSSGMVYEIKSYMNGEVESVEKDARALSVSNGGEYIYFTRLSDSSLHVINAQSGKSSKISNDVTGSPIVNKDGTEILYCNEDGTYFLERDGDEVEVSSATNTFISMITPENTNYYMANMKGTSSLKNKVYLVGDELIYLDDNLEGSRIATGVTYAHMSSDGKTLYYMRNESLYRCTVDSDAKGEKIADDVDSFEVSEDQKHIYFVDLDHNLQYIDAGGDTTEIDSDVNAIAMLSNNRLYFTVDISESSSDSGSVWIFDMYYSQAGADAVEVESDVYSMYGGDPLGKCLTYQLDDSDGDTYFIYVGIDEPVELR